MGTAYSNVIGIIISATVFVAGLEATGVVDALINIMIDVEAIAGLAGAFGPFFVSCYYRIW